VPVRNSIRGYINNHLDMIREKNLVKIKEITIPISHSIGCFGEKRDLIISHPQAIMQCEYYLKEHFPNAGRMPASSTDEGARKVAERKGGIAIANRETLMYHGLAVLKEDIVRDNYSIFWVLKNGRY